MAKKSIVAVILVVGLLAIGVSAFARGPYGQGGGYGWDRGHHGGYGYGYGHGRGQGPGYMMNNSGQIPFSEESTKIWNELHQKRLEMNAVMAAPEVDEEKAKALQAEINTLRNKLSEMRLSESLEFRKRNPDLRQGYGPGYGPGRGRGYGPGYCWR